MNRQFWLLPTLLLVPVTLWLSSEWLAVAQADPAGSAEGRGVSQKMLEESDVPGCLFAWSRSDAVSRGQFTRQVDRNKREPVDQVCKLSSDERKIFYFSDLSEQTGKQIFHLWEYQGREMAKVSLGEVQGPRWRVWSSKNLIPGWQGVWSIKVVTKEGTVLHRDQFEYGNP